MFNIKRHTEYENNNNDQCLFLSFVHFSMLLIKCCPIHQFTKLSRRIILLFVQYAHCTHRPVQHYAYFVHSSFQAKCHLRLHRLLFIGPSCCVLLPMTVPEKREYQPKKIIYLTIYGIHIMDIGYIL